MPFEKGQSGNPSGRPKGSKNRSTTEMREALACLVNKNIEKLDGWLDQIAQDDPKSAFDCVMKLAEYNLPKYSRTVFFEKEQAPNSSSSMRLEDNPSYKEILRVLYEEQENEESLQKRG